MPSAHRNVAAQDSPNIHRDAASVSLPTASRPVTASGATASVPELATRHSEQQYTLAPHRRRGHPPARAIWSVPIWVGAFGCHELRPRGRRRGCASELVGGRIQLAAEQLVVDRVVFELAGRRGVEYLFYNGSFLRRPRTAPSSGIGDMPVGDATSTWPSRGARRPGTARRRASALIERPIGRDRRQARRTAVSHT